MKNKIIKPTKKQLEIMKLYWRMFQAETAIYWGRIGDLEREMSKRTGIKDMEFIHDSMCIGWCGVGNYDRTMRLIHGEELEEN